MGQVFYRDWTPGSFQDPTYNPNGAKLQLESKFAYVPKELPMQPQVGYDNRLSPPEFYLANVQEDGYTSAREFYPYPVSDEYLRFAPEQPVRYDTFNMLAQRALSPNVYGTAPTKNVYTGVSDIGY